ncbi:tRNA adenosine(34) deaminase TadA [Enterobacteriaceae endosymbiont of Donacia versicolorea]|uniref:tRNA adenosine(34) deaminase TadA n=1 Tax=Enterobacteriaceae endosymbiont of Donacia versicolorea TaxID=2675788 RepID=UPI00144A1636|nr:tRNA adenosine(34) deaminase TadA [Enterobacteriaceae endosymbiont of Donacia versicolorea]QJC31922.1 tRNA adenosine(34) deaminase TadA [Enterobacteriaceae endosymbiont of Donacia versicolorea]
MNNDIYWMKYTLKVAILAKNAGEIPVGAIIIKNNKIISYGYNNSIKKNDPTAHAEIIALRKAGKFLKNYRLLNTTMYVTLEPCLMCFGAIIISRITRLVFSSYNKKYNGKNYKLGSFINLLKIYDINHKLKISSGILINKSTNIIKNFFNKKRKNNFLTKRFINFEKKFKT